LYLNDREYVPEGRKHELRGAEWTYNFHLTNSSISSFSKKPLSGPSSFLFVNP